MGSIIWTGKDKKYLMQNIHANILFQKNYFLKLYIFLLKQLLILEFTYLKLFKYFIYNIYWTCIASWKKKIELIGKVQWIFRLIFNTFSNDIFIMGWLITIKIFPWIYIYNHHSFLFLFKFNSYIAKCF